MTAAPCGRRNTSIASRKEGAVTLRRILETPAEDSRFWQDYSYLLGTDDSLLDWSENPGQHCQHGSCWLCRGRLDGYRANLNLIVKVLDFVKSGGQVIAT